MLTETQKTLISCNVNGELVQLNLHTENNSLTLKLHVTHLTIKDGRIKIYSDLSLLDLYLGSISSLGNKINISCYNNFSAEIVFPSNLSKERLEAIDNEIRLLNKLFKNYNHCF
ncbi:MAG: hypothetical protein ACRC1P_03955 [Cellulosilyticaceae bacterium]